MLASTEKQSRELSLLDSLEIRGTVNEWSG